MDEDVFEPHPLVRAIGKQREEFTRADLIRAVEELEIELVGLRYVADDGRLKSLTVPVQSRRHLDVLLTRGERVDGSNVFRSSGTDDSDVYIVPRHRTAFLNPFGLTPSLDLLCAFYDAKGAPVAHAPERLVRRAAQLLVDDTGLTLEAFGEIEYYVVEDEEKQYRVEEERGYQEAPPFSKRATLREQVLLHLTAMGVPVKYGHGEVGNFVEDGKQYTQGEIELLPQPVEDAADSIVLTKWVVREVAAHHGLEVTFAPAVGSSGVGNGLHIHSRLVRNGKNAGFRKDGINDTGKRLIAGYLDLADALTAFGNTVPTSYLRLADGDESPGAICWGNRDRTGLVRVPLGWDGDVTEAMAADANPLDAPADIDAPSPATVEMRVADGSADVHAYLAGLTVAARRGLLDDQAVERANALESTGDNAQDDFEQLPESCEASAEVLERKRAAFEEDDVFPSRVIDAALDGLRGHTASGRVHELDSDARAELVRRFWHRG